MAVPLAKFGSLAFTAVFVQNVIFVELFVSGRFFRAAERPAEGLLYTGGVGAVMVASTAGAWAVGRLLLRPLGLGALSPLCYVLLAALLEGAAALAARRFRPGLCRRLGGLLPALFFGTAPLGVAFLGADFLAYRFWGTVYFAFCAGLGLLIAYLFAWAAAEKLRFSEPPEPFRGLPIALVAAGFISLAFSGFLSIRIPY